MNIDNIIKKITDGINKKRVDEINTIYSSDSKFWKMIRDAKNFDTFSKGNKTKTMRKIASLPEEVDVWFTKVYGVDYYKDKDFFTKHHSEWLVIDKDKI